MKNNRPPAFTRRKGLRARALYLTEAPLFGRTVGDDAANIVAIRLDAGLSTHAVRAGRVHDTACRSCGYVVHAPTCATVAQAETDALNAEWRQRCQRAQLRKECGAAPVLTVNTEAGEAKVVTWGDSFDDMIDVEPRPDCYLVSVSVGVWNEVARGELDALDAVRREVLAAYANGVRPLPSPTRPCDSVMDDDDRAASDERALRDALAADEARALDKLRAQHGPRVPMDVLRREARQKAKVALAMRMAEGVSAEQVRKLLDAPLPKPRPSPMYTMPEELRAHFAKADSDDRSHFSRRMQGGE